VGTFERARGRDEQGYAEVDEGRGRKESREGHGRETGRERLPENYKLYVVPNRPSKIIPAHPAAIMNM